MKRKKKTSKRSSARSAPVGRYQVLRLSIDTSRCRRRGKALIAVLCEMAATLWGDARPRARTRALRSSTPCDQDPNCQLLGMLSDGALLYRCGDTFRIYWPDDGS